MIGGARVDMDMVRIIRMGINRGASMGMNMIRVT